LSAIDTERSATAPSIGEARSAREDCEETGEVRSGEQKAAMRRDIYYLPDRCLVFDNPPSGKLHPCVSSDFLKSYRGLCEH
jgi:hypothetical protein